jgi:hypothetical protein
VGRRGLGSRNQNARWGGQVKPTALRCTTRLARSALATRINAATNEPELSIDRVGTRSSLHRAREGTSASIGSSPAQPPAAAPRFHRSNQPARGRGATRHVLAMSRSTRFGAVCQRARTCRGAGRGVRAACAAAACRLRARARRSFLAHLGRVQIPNLGPRFGTVRIKYALYQFVCIW